MADEPTSDPMELFCLCLEDYAVRYESQMPPQVVDALTRSAEIIRGLRDVTHQYDALAVKMLGGVEQYLMAEAGESNDI